MSQPFHPSHQADRPHVPVLLAEVLESLKPAAGDIYADLTFGAGGYSSAILEAADCVVFAFDRDPDAIRHGVRLQEKHGERLRLVEAAFSGFADELAERDIQQIDGIVMDIGVSSMQIDQAERGFSFSKDGPLDMRMSQSGKSAADVVSQYSAERLADIIYVFGDEPRSRAIGRAIARARDEAPITTTRQLVKAVERATGPHRPHMKTHPATKTFQALRIYVNDELGQLADALVGAERMLKPGGRLVVVSFHSLEDRMVKQFLAERSGGLPGASRYAPGPVERQKPSFQLLFKGHVEAGEGEIATNPRSRSAKLRAALRTHEVAWGKTAEFSKGIDRLRAN